MPPLTLLSSASEPVSDEPAPSDAPLDDLEARLAAVLPADADERVRALGELWLSIRPEPTLLPARRHFHPFRVPPRILPFLWLLDIERSPRPRFRYRLLGTAHVMAMGADFTGRYLDVAHSAFAASASHGDYLAVAAGRPHYRRGRPTFHTDKNYISMERLALPLAADGRHVDMLLAITVYTRPAEGERQAPAASPASAMPVR